MSQMPDPGRRPIDGLVFHGPARPPAVERLCLDPPGRGEVRVRMVGSGVCHSDLHVVDGDWERPSGVVLGHEGAAIIEELGPGVRERPADDPAGAVPSADGGLRAGDLVVLSWVAPCGSCPACSRGEAWLCGSPLGAGHRLAPDLVRLHRDDGSPVGVYSGIGTFSTGQVVSAAAAIPVDPQTPPAVAVLIGCAASTGVGAVRNTAGVRSGESVVIVGLGGVGLSALMAALDAGADPVVAVDLEPAKRDLALALGATHAFGPADAPAGVSALARSGVDHVLECIGLASTVELAVDLVRPGGTATLVGMTRQADRAGLDVYRVVHEGKRVIGSCYGSIVPARDFPAIAADAVSGRLPLGRLVSETIGLADVGRALDALRRRDGARRVVLFPADA
jgi:S-(hydroxymethyl)glutathione dehydrogenase/alcohol dehydrogenase